MIGSCENSLVNGKHATFLQNNEGINTLANVRVCVCAETNESNIGWLQGAAKDFCWHYAVEGV
jgi:hypothetical protein